MITISYPAKSKVQAAVPVPKPVQDSSHVSSRESRVSHATRGVKSLAGISVKDPTAAVRRARWRKKNPEQHRVQQRAARARRKAGAGS